MLLKTSCGIFLETAGYLPDYYDCPGGGSQLYPLEMGEDTGLNDVFADTHIDRFLGSDPPLDANCLYRGMSRHAITRYPMGLSY